MAKGHKLLYQEYKVHPLMGKKVRDVITGVEGTVTNHRFSILHSEQLTIQPMGVDDKGQPIEAFAYDITRIVSLEKPEAKAATQRTKNVPSTGPTRISEHKIH